MLQSQCVVESGHLLVILKGSRQAKLFIVDQHRPAAQIHKTLISEPPTHPASLTENMHCAHITLNAIHLWGVPPNPRDNGHTMNRVLALPQSLHQTTTFKTLIKSHKNQLMALACSQQLQTLLQHAPAPGNPPSCPMPAPCNSTLQQHYQTYT